MTAVPNQPPVRTPSGATSDPPYGPLADSGYGNPAFYHQFFDDFDATLGTTGFWTVTKGTGSAVHGAGDGGIGTLTTAATNTDFTSIQLPAASFSLPQGALAGKKAFFAARFNISDINLSAFIVGLTNITATPFAGIADGIYFTKASGSAVVNVVSAIGSVLTTTVVPAAAFPLVNGTNMDFAFYINKNGDLLVYAGAQLVGWLPQNVVTAPGPALRVSGLSLSTANLTPTIAIQAGAAVAKALSIDFVLAQKER